MTYPQYGRKEHWYPDHYMDDKPCKTLLPENETYVLVYPGERQGFYDVAKLIKVLNSL